MHRAPTPQRRTSVRARLWTVAELALFAGLGLVLLHGSLLGHHHWNEGGEHLHHHHSHLGAHAHSHDNSHGAHEGHEPGATNPAGPTDSGKGNGEEPEGGAERFLPSTLSAPVEATAPVVVLPAALKSCAESTAFGVVARTHRYDPATSRGPPTS